MINEIKLTIKKNKSLKRFALWTHRVVRPLFQIKNVFIFTRAISFVGDYLKYLKLGGVAEFFDLYPCLGDKTEASTIDAHYFYQAIWAFKKILLSKPINHVDVGSDVRFVGMLTTIVKTTFIDIRPLPVTLSNFESKSGSILLMPYADNSIESLSSMHVIEHIGLGRYGDPLDPDGSIKACIELKRVLAKNGMLYVSLPMGDSRVQFNSQRVFSAKKIFNMFDGLKLLEFSVVDLDGSFVENADPFAFEFKEVAGQDVGLGLFIFTKT